MLKIATLPEHKLLIMLAFDSGMRHDELYNAKIGDINWDDKTIYIKGKGNKFRDVPFGNKTKELLKVWLDQQKKGFIYNRKTRETTDRKKYIFDLSYWGIASVFRDIQNKLGYKTYAHSFRRGNAVENLKQGMSLDEARRILGHASDTMTRHYTTHYKTKEIIKNKFKSSFDEMDTSELGLVAIANA